MGKTISSMSELMEFAAEFEGVYFRGEPEAFLVPMQPRLARVDEFEKKEKTIIDEFSRRGQAYVAVESMTILQKLACMQHHGFPTRLLDWSESLSVAAYFACRGENDAKDGYVYIVKSATDSVASGFVAATSYGELKEELGKADSSALNFFRVPHVTPNLAAQNGVLSIQVDPNVGALIKHPKDRQASVRIPAASKPAVLRELLMLGVSESSLFPGIDGLGRDVSWRAEQGLLRAQTLYVFPEPISCQVRVGNANVRVEPNTENQDGAGSGD